MQQHQMCFILHEDGEYERIANHDYPRVKDTWIGEGYITVETSLHIAVEPPMLPLPRATLLLVREPVDDEPVTVEVRALRSTAEQCFREYFGHFTIYDLVPGASYSLYKPFTDSRGNTTPIQHGLTFRFIRSGNEVCFLKPDGSYLELYPDAEDIHEFLIPDENPTT